MTLVLDDTPGGPASNSYSSREAADAYFEGRVGADAWLTADEPAKERALVAATSRLEQEEYDGQRTTEAQRLSWPRYGLTDADGYALPHSNVPRVVQEAAYEQALIYLQTPGAANTNALTQFEEVQVGPLKVTPRQAGIATDPLCAAAKRLLRRYLVSGGGFRVERG